MRGHAWAVNDTVELEGAFENGQYKVYLGGEDFVQAPDELRHEAIAFTKDHKLSIEDEVVDITIDFHSEGHNDPGRTYGPPEVCEAPDYEDTRTIQQITLYNGDNKRVITEASTNPTFWEAITSFFQERVDNEDVDTDNSANEHDPSDFDDVYDYEDHL